ncbi:LacI family DNA-binding transcriptional regulator [Cellulomonas sp. PhB150]|uniref:LacI family DNA-binding transcriptional regulator n=1 Tax=Cellulomonas sp. PhB150 TaxID=2485188 RepID=UPI000FBA5E7D|nr:LacI family DNA-binding transcriptional regulator [Cellulomonas sp. PhB150]ROS31310.1 DNA-binding LacI/PurR family transcriptional regulator [Cellulomonas sp. PhB150]
MQDDVAPGPRVSTLEDVALVAGVSRASVSRVVNGKAGVAAHIVEAVNDAIARTGYVPNRAARSLVTRRSDTVLVVVSGSDTSRAGPWGPGDVLADPFFGRVAGGLMSSLRPRDVHPVLMLAVTDDERSRVLSYVREGSADGVLLVSAQAGDPLPQMLTDAGLPVVLFSRPDHPLPLSYVDVNNRAGGALAADRLVARGCRSVGIVTGPLDIPGAEDRLVGFREAMARHGVAYVPSAAGTFSVESGVAAMGTLLADHRVDGVFASNDNMAVGAILAAQERGLTVPDDVAVVGFDDSTAALMCRPTLTTVRQPIEAMAAEMARLLLERLDAPDQRPSAAIFEPALVERGSA